MSVQESEPREKGVFHPGVTCDGCEGPVFGTRFKCWLCDDYDLCSSCRGKGLHEEHTMFKLEQPVEKGVFHPGVTCDGCEGPVFGTRFKCWLCDDYDLCSSCRGKGLHEEHTMFKLEQPVEKGVFHPGVTCDGCEGPVFGTRFKCWLCDDYDLCSSCRGKGLHEEHTMFKLEQPVNPTRVLAKIMSLTKTAYVIKAKGGQEIHRFTADKQDFALFNTVKAKIGQMEAVLATWNLKMTQKDEDGDDIVVSNAEALKGAVSNTQDEILKIDEDGDDIVVSNAEALKEAVSNTQDGILKIEPTGAIVEPYYATRQPQPSQPRRITQSVPAPQPREKGVFHPGVFCDGCGGPILGTHFKCWSCDDYDLCSSCKGKGLHEEHTMFKLEQPKERGVFHPGVSCDGCGGPIFGTRFKCLKCDDYDLCSSCKGMGLHEEHTMFKLEQPTEKGVFHPGVTCDGCGGPIFGTRFKCRVCDDYNLCSSCRGKGLHEEHTMFKL